MAHPSSSIFFVTDEQGLFQSLPLRVGGHIDSFGQDTGATMCRTMPAKMVSTDELQHKVELCIQLNPTALDLTGFIGFPSGLEHLVSTTPGRKADGSALNPLPQQFMRSSAASLRPCGQARGGTCGAPACTTCEPAACFRFRLAEVATPAALALALALGRVRETASRAIV